MVSVCTVPARGGRSCEHFGGYKTINQIPLPLQCIIHREDNFHWYSKHELVNRDINNVK